MNRKEELWNDKEIATPLAEPGTVTAAVGRKIWSKIPRKTWVKKTCKQVWLSLTPCAVQQEANVVS